MQALQGILGSGKLSEAMQGNALVKFRATSGHYGIRGAAYCEDGSFAAEIVQSREDQRASIRVLKQGKAVLFPEPSIDHDKYQQPELTFSPDCSKVVGAGYGVKPWVLDFDTGKLALLPLDKKAGLSNPKFTDFGTILFEKNLSYKTYSIVSYDIRTRGSREVWSQSGPIYDYNLEPNGALVLAYREPHRNLLAESVVFARVDPQGLRRIIASYILEKGGVVYYTHIISDEFAVIPLQDPHRLLIFSLKQDKIVKEIEGASVRRVNDRLFVFQTLEGGGELPVHLFDLESMSSRRLLSDGLLGKARVLAVHSQGLIANHQSTVDWGSLLAYDLAGNERLIFSGGSSPPNARTERHFINSTDGFVYPAYLFKKLARESSPKGVVIFVHGGGCHVTTAFSPSWKVEEIPELVEAGYDVLMINYRNNDLHTPRYKSPRWTQNECGTKEIDDIVAAQDFLRQSYGAVPLFLWGHSQGGYLVNLAATQHADRLKINGVISSAGMWDYDVDGEPRFLQAHYHRDRMPLASVEKLKAPLLLFHGERDINVSFKHARRFLQKAKELGKNVMTFLPADEAHLILDPLNFDRWMRLFLDFLEQNRGRPTS